MAGGPAKGGGEMRYLVRMTIDIEEAIGKGTEKPEIKSRQVKEIASSQPPVPVSPPMKLLLGIKEVAAALSISRSLVYILMNDGHLPFVKVGKRTMFSVQAIQECLSQRLPPFDSIGKR
jgi:excisionase family DNA binding protein